MEQGICAGSVVMTGNLRKGTSIAGHEVGNDIAFDEDQKDDGVVGGITWD